MKWKLLWNDKLLMKWQAVDEMTSCWWNNNFIIWLVIVVVAKFMNRHVFDENEKLWKLASCWWMKRQVVDEWNDKLLKK